jgi:protein tyrosine/serine phosphatase
LKVLKPILMVLAVAGATCTSYAAYCGVLIWNGNLHAVIKGEVYRSAQLTRAELAHEIDAHGIRSVLNLRGANADKRWYRDELAESQERGVAHYDIGISARKPVPAEKIAEILAVLRNAPKPILVHCASGADRTGFVSALYRYAILAQPAEKAEHELSLRYGHFPYLASKSKAMDKSAEAYFRDHSAVGADRQSVIRSD